LAGEQRAAPRPWLVLDGDRRRAVKLKLVSKNPRTHGANRGRWILAVSLVALLSLGLFLSRSTPAPQDPLDATSQTSPPSAVRAPSATLTAPELRAIAQQPIEEQFEAEPLAPISAEPAVARISVVDALTDAALEQVALYRVTPLLTQPTASPSKAQLEDCFGRKLRSPILLAQIGATATPSEPSTYFACTPQHAWGQIGIDPNSSGEYVLRLQPGGSLQLHVLAARREPGIQVVLSRTDSPQQFMEQRWPLHELLQGDDPKLELEGLATGAYRASAQYERGLKLEVLATQEFQIHQGERTQVALVIGAAQPPLVTVLFNIDWDPAWQLSEFTLEIQSMDPAGDAPKILRIKSTDMHRFQERRYADRVELPARGAHRFRIPEAMFESVQELDDEDSPLVILRIPAPGQVVVEVLDATNGALVLDATLERLNPQSDDASGMIIPATAPGRFTFDAPIGPLQLRARSERLRHYPAILSTLGVAPGHNPHNLEFVHDFLLVVNLQAGDATWKRPVKLPLLMEFETTSGEKVTPKRALTLGAGRFEFHFARPGTLKLKPFTIPGCLATPEFTLEFDPLASRTWILDYELVAD
jgi:hypothetical protein